MKFSLSILLGLLGASALAGNFTTFPTVPGGSLGPLSDTSIATWGQTFRSPSVASTLDRFQLDLEIFDAGEFRFFISEWDGDSATGTALYESSTFNATAGDLLIDVTPGLSLTPNTDYVAFVNNSAFRNSGLSLNAAIDTGSVPYADGDLFLLDNGTDFGALTSTPWTQVGVDSAFSATISSVPEGDNIGIIAGMGLLSVIAFRLRFRRNQQGV